MASLGLVRLSLITEHLSKNVDITIFTRWGIPDDVVVVVVIVVVVVPVVPVVVFVVVVNVVVNVVVVVVGNIEVSLPLFFIIVYFVNRRAEE